MGHLNIVPTIEKRLETWINIHDKLGKHSSDDKKYTITLSREYGCEAYPLALKLCDNLTNLTGQQWAIFDRAIIEEIAKEEKLSKKFLMNLGNSTEVFDIFTANLLDGVSQEDAFKKIVDFMTRIALRGNAIIIGRGSSIITKDFENCFHFRLQAPYEFRVNSIARRGEIPIEEARKLISKNEGAREKFLNNYFGQRIDDIRLYHAIFNNEKLSVDQLSQSIVNFMSPSLVKEKNLSL